MTESEWLSCPNLSRRERVICRSWESLLMKFGSYR